MGATPLTEFYAKLFQTLRGFLSSSKDVRMLLRLCSHFCQLIFFTFLTFSTSVEYQNN